MNYYVDNQINASGNGASWSSAWKDFSAINWSVVKPGDTVYISGGTSSQTYNDTLTIGASGSAASAVTITKGVDAGHNGAVIIDGRNTLPDGVYDNGHNDVVVSGLTIRNIADAGVSVKYVTEGVVIENNSVYSGDPGGGNARGYDVRNSVGQNGQNAVVVEGNSFSTPASTAAQTDGIWSSGNNGVLFQGNSIIIANTDSTGHSDGIQSYQDTNITIAGNYFAHPNGGLNNHGLWITDIAAGGTVKVYNNVVSMPVGDEIGIAVWNQDPGWTGKALVLNNSVNGGYYSYMLWNTPLSELKNNIGVPAAGRIGISIANGSPAPANVDNNLIWAPSATVANINNVNETWGQWQALGYDTHGVNANPLFTNAATNDFTLQSNSPAINAGVSLPGLTTDYAGDPRPQGNGFDIGAYEVTPANGSTPTPTPTPTPAPTPTPTANTLTATDQYGTAANVPMISSGSSSTTVGRGVVSQSVSASGADTVSFASITSDTLQLGSGTVDMNFISPRALTATGGSGTDTITANSGNNRFVAGTGALTVTGGSGHNSFVFHADDGSLTITDFSHRRDTLTVDQSLKGSFQEASDGNGGTLITFGTAGHGIDLAHVSYLSESRINFV